jgi:hypothetical protein
MNSGLEIIIIAALWITQIALGVLSLWRSRKLHRKFAYALASRTSVVDLLEKFSRVYGPINVKVNAAIKQPAILRPDILWVNREVAYNSDLYSTFYTSFQLAMLNLNSRWFQMLLPWQVLAYFGQIIVAVLVFTVSQAYLPVLLGIAAGLFVVSLFLYFYSAYISETAVEIAADLLDLDKVEIKRAQLLASLFQADIFKYSIYPIIWVIRFIIPWK